MKGVYALIAALMIAGCSSLPEIRPASGLALEQRAVCSSVFVQKSTRFIHSIEARAAGKAQAVMIGVTLLNPQTRTVSTAIISAEGLSLFEATSVAGKLKVGRALPPFDAPDFARNMMRDIDLIFLAPQGTITAQGVGADGRAVCRWHQNRSGWVDISRNGEGQYRIERYTEGGRRERNVTITAGAGSSYAAIDLQASELVSYHLLMTLIESEAVTEEIKY